MPALMLTGKSGGTWSIQEHIGHLLDLEPLWSGRLDELIEGLVQLRAADMTNKATYEADHNSASIEDLLASFREARTNFVARLDELDDSLIERTALHPRLQKRMRTIDLAFFVAEHDDHHFAQISRLKREFVGS